MNRFFLIAFCIGVFSTLPGTMHSQIITKDFQQMESKSKVQQNILVVDQATNVPHVEDITKLKRTTDLPLEEQQALAEEFAPDSVFVRKLKQQDQAIFQESAALKTQKSVSNDLISVYRKRWFPVEENEE